MIDPESLSVRTRTVALVVLLVVLGGLFVWAGTMSYANSPNDFPGNDDVGPNPDTYIGDRVSLGGTVTATDPITVEMEYGYPERRTDLVVRNVDADVSEGDELSAFGTLTGPAELSTERTIVREPWEIIYMYLVSFLAGLWVLGRLLRHWRPSRDDLGVHPRGEHDA